MLPGLLLRGVVAGALALLALRDVAVELAADLALLLGVVAVVTVVTGRRVAAGRRVVEVRARLGGLEVEFVDHLLLFLGLLPEPCRFCLQELLTESVGAAPGQFAHVFQSVDPAAEHRGVDAGFGERHVFSLVNEVEATDHLFIALEPAYSIAYTPSTLISVITSSITPTFSAESSGVLAVIEGLHNDIRTRR